MDRGEGMYFFTDTEQKYLINKLLPKARERGIEEELRGWNWHSSPVKPYYESKIPMYLVCSQYCPTHRDVYLKLVENVRERFNYRVSQGIGMHKLVEFLISSYQDGKEVEFEKWWEEKSKNISDPSWVEPMRRRAIKIWELVETQIKYQLIKRKSEQPYSNKRDILATAIPLLVGHRVSGELLGLSGLLTVDAYDYLRNIVFDLKVSDEEKDWYRLYPTGYAMVLESIYEVPIDIGVVVYLRFNRDDEPYVKKDMFFIDDDLRSWWIEERDKKLKIVAERLDPGLPKKCEETCIYYHYCRGEGT